MNINKQKQLYGMNYFLILIISIVTLLFMTINANDNGTFSNSVFITSIFIQIFSIVNIFSRENEPYSLNKIFYLFSFFFFGIAPLLQFYNNTLIWATNPLSESQYLLTNILIIIILLLYQIFYNTFRKLRINSNNKITKYTIGNFSKNQTFLLAFISIIAFLIVFQSNNFNIIPMLIRGGDYVTTILGTSSIDESPTKWLIVTNFIRPLPIICFLYYFMAKNKKNTISIFFFLIAILTSFPTALSRYAAAAMYIPVILLTIPFARRKNIFSLILIIGLLLIFPFLNNFRNFGEYTEIKLGFDFQMFLTGDFDSYQNFALIVSNDIVTYGSQLLGVIFFWVPRSLWPGKPIGSGAFLADKLNLIFSNISANYFAEGYINFGFFGIFIFLLLIAYLTAKFDKIYWTRIINLNNNFLTILYLISLGMLFFMLRGDLMSSFAYTIGFILAALFVYKIVNFKTKNKQNEYS